MRTLIGTMSRICRARKLLEVSDPAGSLKISRMILERRVLARLNSSPIKVRARLLNEEVSLRPGTSDAVVFWETFVVARHLPPDGVEGPFRRIWDLGSNIGLTVAHLAATFPEARVTGVELDANTAKVARSNIVPWADRASVLTGAVWTSDGTINYAIQRNEEYGAHVITGPCGMTVSAPSFSLNTLLRDDEVVDYVKMDIEGAEAQVLRKNTEWLQRVRSLKVETHGAYSTDECQADLRRHGFRVRLDDFYPPNVVTAVRG